MVRRVTLYGLLVLCIAATVNAECTSSGCSQGTSTVLNCPPGTSQHDNYCFQNNICPPNTVYKNGVCEENYQRQDLQCPVPYKLKDGVCVNEQLIQSCSSNSQNCIVANSCQSGNCNNNIQIDCGPSMINVNGGCAPLTVATCPYSTTLQNGRCISDNTCTSSTCNSESTVCPIDSTMVGNICVRNTPCSRETVNINGACGTCPYDKTPEKGKVCEPTVIIINQTISPPASVIMQPPVVHIIDSIKQQITERPVIVYVPVEQKTSVQQTPPSNHLNIIDITNIVNTSNIHNVVTNINGVNINNITLGSRAGAQNYGNHRRSETSGEESGRYHEDDSVNYEETCCVIMEPRTCVPVGDRMKCFHRRHHKCGAECNESGRDPDILIGYQTYPEKADTPIEETTTDSLEDEITAVPETNPNHYHYVQPYPDQTNLYQGQTNQYHMTYPGQDNSYLLNNQGRPNSMPYPFLEGHNAGYPMSYPGQQYPTSYSDQQYPTSYSGQQYPTSYPGQQYPTSSSGQQYPTSYPGQQNSLPYPYPEGQNVGTSMTYPGQPLPMPQPSDGVHDIGVPMPYPSQPNPVSYPYQGHNFGVSMPYPGQSEQYSYPSQYPGGMSSTMSPFNCVQQLTWPFLNCAQNVKIDCNQCQQTRCHPMCY